MKSVAHRQSKLQFTIAWLTLPSTHASEPPPAPVATVPSVRHSSYVSVVKSTPPPSKSRRTERRARTGMLQFTEESEWLKAEADDDEEEEEEEEDEGEGARGTT
jgi:hypothetical protein